MAPHPENLNEEVTFPGITAALFSLDDSDPATWKREVGRQVAIVVVCLQRARNILLESYPAEAFNDSW